MSEHIELMRQMRMGRSDYLRALRKQQPIAELERKAAKAKTRSHIYTQEERDLACAVAVNLIAGLCVE